MSFGITVKGGTNAGCKRPLSQPHAQWSCSQGHDNPGYAIRCLTTRCNEKRA